MNQKLPYYMAYPMPLAYDDERTERMEYETSMVFDEYPDKLQLRLMCGRIYENARRNEKRLYGTSYNAVLEKTGHGTTGEMAGTSGNEGMSRSEDADMPEENTVCRGIR